MKNKRNVFYSLIIMLAGVIYFPVQAQQKNRAQDNDAIKAVSHAPNSFVRTIKRDRKGNIWLVANEGIIRYDGKSFTNITGKLSSARFLDVLEDRKGDLWFASAVSGVYKYDGKTFQHFTTREGLASNTVQSIYEDRAGNIWFGASRYDGKSFRTFTTKDGFPGNSIRLLLEDKTGKLWFGGHGENMFVYDARLNGEVGQGKTFTVLKNKDGKVFNSVWSIIEDKKGNIWFSEDGLWRYDGRTFTKVSQRGAYAIIEDKKGNIWTSSGKSILCYDGQSLSTINPTVKEIEISGGNTVLFGLLEANDGSIWVGSRGPSSGVHRYDGKTITDFKNKDGQK